MANTWLEHTLRRTGWRPQNQAAALALLSLAVTLILGVLYLSQVASFATTNREIQALILERDRLERTNEQLRAEIASLKTVPRLLTRAEELTFAPAEAADIEYLVIDGYHPDQEVEIDFEIENPLDLTPVYEETFGGWLRQQWDSLQQQFTDFGS